MSQAKTIDDLCIPIKERESETKTIDNLIRELEEIPESPRRNPYIQKTK